MRYPGYRGREEGGGRREEKSEERKLEALEAESGTKAETSHHQGCESKKQSGEISRDEVCIYELMVP